MKKIRQLLSTIIILAIAAGMWHPVNVNAKETIKVGFFAFEGYHNEDENGYRSGYGYEFIQKMLRYNDYTAEYVGYDKNWSQMQDMLENGEIDVLTSAQKTPEREEKFDFSKPIGTSAAILTVKAGDERFVAGEYSTYEGMRIGVIEGNSRNDKFVEYAKEKGFSYSFVYYDDMDSLTNDLQKGANIDAIVTSDLRSIKNEWILDKFASSSFYAMVKKGNTKLLEQIDYAIDQMNSNSVGWQDVLFDKYYSGTSGDTIALSSTEREYLSNLIESGNRIKVLVNPDRAPYSYVEDGTYKGILPEIFEETANRLGLPYEYVICNTREEYQKLTTDKSVDVIIDGRNDLSAAENMGYKLTDEYMQLAYSVVERAEFTGEVKKVAAMRLADTSEKNMNYFIDGKETVYFDTMKECVAAVINKEADACYLYDYCGQMFSIQNIKGELQSTTLPDIDDSLAFGVNDQNDYRLLAILNKGVISIRENYVDTAIRNNIDFSIGKLSLIQTLYRNPGIMIIIMVMITLILILAVYILQRRKNIKKDKKRTAELERFISYVCKSNTSVMEVNFITGKAKEYIMEDGHVKYINSKYKYGNLDEIHNEIPDEDFEIVDKIINKDNIISIIDNHEDRYFECRLKEKNDYRWYAVTITAIPRDYEHPQNVIIFKRDIDELKRKEEETKQSLREALDAANQASESKGSFLSNMSHEIRTPLNAIIGYLALAQEMEIGNDKLSHCVDNCEVASRHLLQIINDILDMSSIESGKMKIAHEDFDLKREITDITTIFFQNAKQKNVNFETHIEYLTEEWVVGDQLRLNQVLMNLLSNAVKFTPANGSIDLSIRQINEDDKKVYIRFKVSDTGIGMSKEYMSRIFKPFEQENAGTAKKFGGSGLGLSITNNLVKMMGGTIDVDSVQNEGTAFTVTLYFDKSSVSHERANVKADYSHVRVLVVDDKENECTYVKTMLKRCGVKSDCVTSGEAALKRIKSRTGGDYSYDLCIIDWNMPGMNGCEVTKQIRQEFGDNMPIIIATAYDITEFEEEAKKVGANQIVAKPLFQSTLFDILVSTFGEYDPEADRKNSREKIDMTGIHVLLAEDNPMNMDIAVTMLEKAGIKVDQAANGQEAVNIFTACEPETYDMILMDVQMPVMDGYEATKTIRASSHQEAKTIPVIAMTANAFAEDVTEALANGMNAHIAKPINYDKLFELLKKFSK